MSIALRKDDDAELAPEPTVVGISTSPFMMPSQRSRYLLPKLEPSLGKFFTDPVPSLINSNVLTDAVSISPYM